jgi:hypothetical protein
VDNSAIIAAGTHECRKRFTTCTNIYSEDTVKSQVNYLFSDDNTASENQVPTPVHQKNNVQGRVKK